MDFFRKMPFPKHNYLYIYAAIGVSFINLMFLLVIDISLIYIYLWVLIFLTLSNLTGKLFILKFIFYLISPIPIVILLINLSLNSEINIVKSSFNHPLLQHLSFAFLSFPFILLFIRIKLIIKTRYRLFYSNNSIIVFLILILLISTAFFIISSLKPLPDENIIQANIVTQDGKTKLFLKSSSMIRDIEIKNNSKTYKIDVKSKEYQTDLESFPKNYDLKLNKKVFDDKLKYNLRVSSKNNVEYLRIFLKVPKIYYPLESNYQFAKNDNFIYEINNKYEDAYNFIIPRNIGQNFDFEVILKEGKKYKLFVQLEYPQIEQERVDFNKKEAFIYKKTIFIETFNL